MRRGLLLLLLCWPGAAFGQSVFEAAGVRALGMAGAFVAVADDSTAVFWNPAGLASGQPAGMSVGWIDFRIADPHGPPVPGADHRKSKFVSLGAWPVGVSYGHFQEQSLVIRPDSVRVAESIKTSQYGLTVLQTVTQGLVVGATLKYVRGLATSMPIEGTSAEEALDRVADLDGEWDSKFDIDLGTMADMGKVRVGLTVRNLLQPTFVDNAGFATVFHRATRVGVAVLPVHGLILAMDLDLDTVDLRDGPRRILALGVEDRIGRVALRGGVRWSREGAQRRVLAFGASVAIRPKFWLDTEYTQGKIDADRGYGFATRVGF